MKIANFRSHEIVRTCTKNYANYNRYKTALSTDFKQRCAYCNIHEDTLGLVSFQIDHFVPKAAFEGKKDALLTQYNNLIWACPKCNNAKTDQFSGDILIEPPSNDYFYDPVTVDYNTIFYRDENGSISSDDTKGNDIIGRLKLYRPLHNFAWVYELIDKLEKDTKSKIEQAAEDDKEKLKNIHYKLLCQKDDLRKWLYTAYKAK